MKKLLLVLVLLSLPVISVAEQVIELVPLRSQLPQNIIPAIQPLLGNDEAISSMQNQLILKVEKSRMAGIMRIIRQLDSPPKRLMIEVSHEGGANEQGSGYDVKGKIRSSGNSRVNVNIKQRKTRNQYDSNQRIQATEGYPALINYGEMIPYQEYDIQVRGNQVRKQQYTSYRDATSGFYVIPRLNGNRVSLEIQQHRNRYQRTDGSMDVQNSSTFVSGQLGEWIRLGSIAENTSRKDRGLIQRHTTGRFSDQQVFVRVTIP